MRRGLLVAALAGCVATSTFAGTGGQAQPRADAQVRFESWRQGRPELRGGVPYSAWRFDGRFRFQMRPGCVERLEGLGVAATRLPHPTTAGPDPVVIDGNIGGVTFQKKRRGAPFVIACALAERLPAFAATLRAHGIDRVEVSSAYRREPTVSYHHLGLALDLTQFDGPDVALEVERDWTLRPGAMTCPPSDDSPAADNGTALRRLACAFVDSGLFSTVLTPEYGRGHANHFHVDARPDDPWLFVR